MSELLPLIVIVAGLGTGLRLFPVLRLSAVVLTSPTRTTVPTVRRVEYLNVR